MAARLANLHHKKTWAQTWKAAEAALESFASEGCVVNHGEFHRDMCGVAVPFVVRSDTYALSLGAPMDELPDTRIRAEIAPQLRKLALTVREALRSEVRR